MTPTHPLVTHFGWIFFDFLCELRTSPTPFIVVKFVNRSNVFSYSCVSLASVTSISKEILASFRRTSKKNPWRGFEDNNNSFKRDGKESFQDIQENPIRISKEMLRDFEGNPFWILKEIHLGFWRKSLSRFQSNPLLRFRIKSVLFKK